MRTVNSTLVEEYAGRIKPLLPAAARAYGTQAKGSPTREASDKVNELILEYVDKKGGNVTHLAHALEGPKGTGISYAGVRRRLRVARSGGTLGTNTLGSSARRKRTRDPVHVQQAADKIKAARDKDPTTYAETVREVYEDDLVSLGPVAKLLGINYYSLWSAMRTSTRSDAA